MMLKSAHYLVLLLSVLFSVFPTALSVRVTTAFQLSGQFAEFLGVTVLRGQVYAIWTNDQFTATISRVNLQSGSMTVIAGSVLESMTDGIGTAAGIYSPDYGLVANERTSDLYFIDRFPKASSYAIRKVNVDTGAVTTVAGTSSQICNSLGTPAPPQGDALNSWICRPKGLAMFGDNVYFLDDDQLRMFNGAGNGTLTNIVGNHNCWMLYQETYTDSPTGVNACININNGPVAVTHSADGSVHGWIRDHSANGANPPVWLHHVNLSNPNNPMNTLNSPSGLGMEYGMCVSGMEPDALYILKGCASSSASGQLVLYTVNAVTPQIQFLAGNGSCQTSDGNEQTAAFGGAFQCVSLSVTATGQGETLVVVDRNTAGQNGALRVVTIGDAAPFVPSSPPSSAASFWQLSAVSLSTIVLLLFVSVQCQTFTSV